MARIKLYRILRDNSLIIATCVAVIAALVLGFCLRGQQWTERQIMYLAFPGDIFLRMLKCMILPLIVASMVSSVGSLDSKATGRIGRWALLYYFGTTVCAIVLGIVLVCVIAPGRKGGGDHQDDIKHFSKPMTTADTVLDLIRNLFPPNILEACFLQYSTKLEKINNETDLNKWRIHLEKVDGANITGLILFSLVLGVVLSKMEEAGRPLLAVFDCLAEASIKMTSLIINLTPFGVFFLILAKVLSTGNFGDLVSGILYFSGTVILALAIHGFLVLPLIYLFVVRKNPFRFLGNMTQALVTAFGTSSSAATLPVTISCLESRNRIDPKIVKFCVPIGATVNMDGTALYEAVSAIYVSQLRNWNLSFTQIVVVSVTATLASVGAAGIPQAGLVTMVIVFNAIGLPTEDIALLLAVDWLLDRCRTAINVLGDAIGCAVVEKLSKEESQTKEMTNGIVSQRL